MLYACSALITVRSVFRVVEYIMGTDGFLLSHEWPTYSFDAVLMLAVQVIFVVWFPDKLNVKGNAEDEVKGSEYQQLNMLTGHSNDR